ncbi:MAG: GlsB/YeaQ/YmgE family stress response membrane protein [Bacilli bacterium]|nr:GlsB/YeaQ/YmgE family stress response membrane protein [Bacilli bacterium]
MYILLWLLFGAFVGWIASILTHNNLRMGLLSNIVVGLVGSVIGGVVAEFFNLASFNSFSFWGFVFAILGAVILLAIINAFRGRRH